MKKGVYFSLIVALISGLSIFINGFAAKILPNIYVFTTVKNCMVSLFLISLIIFFKKYKELRGLTKKDWLNLSLVGLIGGGIPFLLFFKGLSISAEATISGAFIHKTLFVWVALISFIFLKEKLSPLQYSALAIILFGIYLLGGPQNLRLGTGELLILSATLMWATEATLVKKLLGSIDTSIAAFGRMFFGSLTMITYLILSNNFASILTMDVDSIKWVILTSVFLLLYVFFYYKALQLEKATVVTSILTLAFPVTVALKNINLDSIMPKDIIGISTITLGIIMFIYLSKITRITNISPNVKSQRKLT